MTSDLDMAILAAVGSLEPGEIMTYGEVAEVAGFPGRARAVGMILSRTGEPVPWWRVVGAGLRIVSPQGEHQAKLLMAEGHSVVGNRIGLGETRD